MAEKIRMIQAKEIEDTVCALFEKANRVLPPDLEHAICEAKNKESMPLCKSVLSDIEDNLRIARSTGLPVCQDTGAAVIFADVGRYVHIEGGVLNEICDRGVRRAYLDGGLRCSVVKDPLYFRTNTTDNTPCFLHIRYTDGDRLKLTCAPKGFGSENMSVLRMFTPSATDGDIVSFVCDSVKRAGANPCPPVILGIGIGGTFDTVTELAKRALLRSLDEKNPCREYAELEERITREVNALKIGSQGFGGDITALSVMIETAPTHIAGLPVAVCFGCHVNRHASAVL